MYKTEAICIKSDYTMIVKGLEFVTSLVKFIDLYKQEHAILYTLL